MVHYAPRIAVFLVACLLLCGCGGSSKVSKANADQISEGMSQEQVVAILGPATESSSGVRFEDGGTSQIMNWKDGSKVIVVVFFNGKVAMIETMGF